MMRKVVSTTPLNLTAALNLLTLRCTRRFSSDDTLSSNSRVSELPRVESLVDGCDYNHWLVVMNPPENYPQRDEIIQQYVSTLAMALGSEEAAKKSIYSVSTKYYYAFSCQVTEDLTHKIKSLPRVKWVLPDSYLSPEESGYGGKFCVDYRLRQLWILLGGFVINLVGFSHKSYDIKRCIAYFASTEKCQLWILREPYFDGKVVPYEDKYHAFWLNEEYKNDGSREKTSSRKPRRRKRRVSETSPEISEADEEI